MLAPVPAQRDDGNGPLGVSLLVSVEGMENLSEEHSPGDAVMLEFDASALPPLAPGHERSYFFFAHGYEKDMDDHTAEPLTVDPLPFRSMSSYPYPATEAYPSGPEHVRYRLLYNTRRVLSSAWTEPAGAAAP